MNAQKSLVDHRLIPDTDLVLLCRNEEGYRNLSFMVSKAFMEGFYIKPRIDMDL